MRSERRRAPAARQSERARVGPKEGMTATSPDIRLLRKSESWAAPPIEKRWDSKSNKPGADCRIARIGHDGAVDDVCRGEDEDNDRGGISGNAKVACWTLVTFSIHEQR